VSTIDCCWRIAVENSRLLLVLSRACCSYSSHRHCVDIAKWDLFRNLFGDGSSRDVGDASLLALDLVVLGVLVLPPAWTDPFGDFPGDAIELT
jgi:hypothetical protein